MVCAERHLGDVHVKNEETVQEVKSIDMVLHCPPHKSHLCHACGCIWRPADVPTNGVEQIQTRGRKDNFPSLPEKDEPGS